MIGNVRVVPRLRSKQVWRLREPIWMGSARSESVERGTSGVGWVKNKMPVSSYCVFLIFCYYAEIVFCVLHVAV